MPKNFFERPYLSLLPFLLVYFLLVLTRSSSSLAGDEGRYLDFANNLLNGFYSPPSPNINLWNGPGFPLYLLPFVALKLPLLVIKLFNAILYYATLILFNRALLKFLDAKRSFLLTLLYACYYMPYKSLPFIHSETLTIFLIACVTMFAVNYFSSELKYKKSKHTVLFALLLSFLAMTKVIFGMVYLFSLVLFLLLFLLTKNILYRKSFLLLIFSLVFSLPYLLYTHSLTSRYFYWSNAAGMSLYWMSNTVPSEWGEWHNDSLTSQTMDPKSQAIFQSNHQKEYAEIYKNIGVQRDDKFKELALRNLKEHPLKIFKNWLANWSRMFFNYPVSYTPFRLSTLGNMLANIPVLILMIYSAILTWRNKRKIPFSLKFLFCIAGPYLIASSVLSAYDRMFYILAPVFGIWISYSVSLLRKKALQNE